MSIFDTGAATALNHLLRREPWAREKLAPFSGEVVEIRCVPLPLLRITVLEGGTVLQADPSSHATLVITAKPAIFSALVKGEDDLISAVEIFGNARLATEILTLLRYLRWDVEEDLSRVFGDVLAHRLISTANDFVAWQADAGRRFAENVMEYAIDERRAVVARTEFDTFAAAVAKVRDDLARMEQRVELLQIPRAERLQDHESDCGAS
ncbi:MAG: SCP2 domain-containing protein [Betaproteobacteria bacterium]|nr:SCP2 domain-containing protein [Betaproteobacteria bacterium]